MLVPILAGSCLLANGGTFFYNGASWGGFGGTAAGTTSAWTSNPGSNGVGLAASITLTSPASGDNWTLYGTLSYTVLWIPASGTDIPPANADVYFNKQGCLTVAGTGVASITNGATTLAEMDDTNNYLSGATEYLSGYSVDVITAISLQPDGSYQASGSITTDTLTTDYDSSTHTTTIGQEYLTPGNITGVS